jgi:hypothetical protein
MITEKQRRGVGGAAVPLNDAFRGVFRPARRPVSLPAPPPPLIRPGHSAGSSSAVFMSVDDGDTVPASQVRPIPRFELNHVARRMLDSASASAQQRRPAVGTAGSATRLILNRIGRDILALDKKIWDNKLRQQQQQRPVSITDSSSSESATAPPPAPPPSPASSESAATATATAATVAATDMTWDDAEGEKERGTMIGKRMELMERDMVLNQLDGVIAAKKEFLGKKRRELEEKQKTNEYLHKVSQDYARFEKHLVAQKQEQYNVFMLLKTYLQSLMNTEKEVDVAMKQTQQDESRLVAQVDGVGNQLNKLMSEIKANGI